MPIVLGEQGEGLPGQRKRVGERSLVGVEHGAYGQYRAESSLIGSCAIALLCPLQGCIGLLQRTRSALRGHLSRRGQVCRERIHETEQRVGMQHLLREAH